MPLVVRVAGLALVVVVPHQHQMMKGSHPTYFASYFEKYQPQLGTRQSGSLHDRAFFSPQSSKATFRTRQESCPAFRDARKLSGTGRGPAAEPSRRGTFDNHRESVTGYDRKYGRCPPYMDCLAVAALASPAPAPAMPRAMSMVSPRDPATFVAHGTGKSKLCREFRAAGSIPEGETDAVGQHCSHRAGSSVPELVGSGLARLDQDVHTLPGPHHDWLTGLIPVHVGDGDAVHRDDVESMTFQLDKRLSPSDAFSSRQRCTSPGRRLQGGIGPHWSCSRSYFARARRRARRCSRCPAAIYRS